MPAAADGAVHDEPGWDGGQELEHLPGHHRLVREGRLRPAQFPRGGRPALASAASVPPSAGSALRRLFVSGLMRQSSPAPRTSNCRSVVSPNRLGGSGRSGGFTAPSGGWSQVHCVVSSPPRVHADHRSDPASQIPNPLRPASCSDVRPAALCRATAGVPDLDARQHAGDHRLPGEALLPQRQRHRDPALTVRGDLLGRRRRRPAPRRARARPAAPSRGSPSDTRSNSSSWYTARQPPGTAPITAPRPTPGGTRTGGSPSPSDPGSAGTPPRTSRPVPLTSESPLRDPLGPIATPRSTTWRHSMTLSLHRQPQLPPHLPPRRLTSPVHRPTNPATATSPPSSHRAQLDAGRRVRSGRCA